MIMTLTAAPADDGRVAARERRRDRRARIRLLRAAADCGFAPDASIHEGFAAYGTFLGTLTLLLLEFYR